MRILVTNDDGIDSVGLHELARALQPVGEVVVCAPDSEYSGASASVGYVVKMRPELHQASIDDVEQAWTINGPPALCVLLARLGALGGDPFDMVVAGINPGANVGGAVYHSGTVGAALTARQGGIPGIAVSQAVTRGSRLGQGVEEGLDEQIWPSAAHVAAVAARQLRDRPLPRPGVLNINVPNRTLSDIVGCAETTVESRPFSSLTTVTREPKPGHEGAYYLDMKWTGRRGDPDPTTDAGAVDAGLVSLSWIGELSAASGPALDRLGAAIGDLIGP